MAGDREVLLGIAIEITDRNESRTGCPEQGNGRAKIAGAIAQQNRHGVRVVVGKGEVLFAIAVEIAHCDGKRSGANREVSGGVESAVAIAQ